MRSNNWLDNKENIFQQQKIENLKGECLNDAFLFYFIKILRKEN